MAAMTKSREATLKKIITYVDGAGAAGVSIRDVSRLLNMGGEKNAATPHVRDMLDQLVELGYLRKEIGVVETERGHHDGWQFYSVPEGQS